MLPLLFFVMLVQLCCGMVKFKKLLLVKSLRVGLWLFRVPWLCEPCEKTRIVSSRFLLSLYEPDANAFRLDLLVNNSNYRITAHRAVAHNLFVIQNNFEHRIIYLRDAVLTGILLLFSLEIIREIVSHFISFCGEILFAIFLRRGDNR